MMNLCKMSRFIFVALTGSFLLTAATSRADDTPTTVEKGAQGEAVEDSSQSANVKDKVNQGEKYLHEATRLKITASNFGDLSEVTRLCKQAIREGLDQQNLKFARQLLAATLFERGSRVCDEIFERSPPNDNWPTLALSARVSLEEAVEHQKIFPEAYLLIGRLHLLPGGNKERAKSALDMAISQSQADPVLQAMALTLRGEIRETPKAQLADFNAALRLQPVHIDALRLRGTHYLSNDDPEKAVEDFRRLVALKPGDATVHELLGLALLFASRTDESLEVFNRVIEIDPDRGDPYAYRSEIFLHQKEFDRALDDINRAIDRVVDNLGWRLLRAQIYWRQKKYADALKDIERVLVVDPKRLHAIRMRAAVLTEDGQLDEAIAGMERAVEALPEENDLLMNLAVYYTSNHQTNEALRIYDKLLDRSLPHAIIYQYRGDLFLNIGKQAEAIKDYDQALKLQPNASGILNNLAWVLATSTEDELRDAKRALELAKRACEVTQYKEAHILSTLAAAFAEKGDFTEAVRWSEEAVKLGNPAVDDQLKAELKSYREGKPWREKHTASQDTENNQSEQASPDDTQELENEK
ncbi:MAG: tetratricopeptide repeat protein [Pirellulales bacterium]|nr:tetratricopeptide repeat protein [Pirellulales bacterium]